MESGERDEAQFMVTEANEVRLVEWAKQAACASDRFTWRDAAEGRDEETVPALL